MEDTRIVEFDKVLAAELDRIRQRRTTAQCEPGNPAGDAFGLALSGGGIRSATFNLGILQALERYGFFRRVDFLSTVSGGGYIGSCLTWFMSANGGAFPFGTKRKDYGTGGTVLAWLRDRGCYLTPGGALNLWALIGAVLAGTLATLAVVVPVLFAGVYWLSHATLLAGPGFTIPFAQPPVYAWLAPPGGALQPDGFAWLMTLGLFAFGAFVLLVFVYALLSSCTRLRSSRAQSALHRLAGRLLAGGTLLAALGLVPWAYELLRTCADDWLRSAMSAVSLSGILSMGGALIGRRPGTESKGWRAGLLGLGLALAVYGLLLWFYHLMAPLERFPEPLTYALGFSVVIALAANINHVSMHRFYRNRLMEAYMPETLAGARPGSADLCRLHAISQTAAPYHLINANVQLAGSANVKYRTRGGDSFVFAPEFSGSTATGFVATGNYAGGMNLATALAISGAAVNPNTRATRSRPLTFLMTLFNARLGYWIRNPRHPSPFKGWSRPHWYWYLLREMLGTGLDENAWQIHLSDGGHFENLGLYELIRRRCKFIIVCDAGADPDFTFGDLARAIELVRTDFGTAVDLNVDAIRPRGEERISSKAFVAGEIRHADGEKGRIIYVKAAMLDGLPEDVNGYRREHPQFPHQTTADQFFDEAQFEAYRELGYQIGERLFASHPQGDLAGLFGP